MSKPYITWYTICTYSRAPEHKDSFTFLKHIHTEQYFSLQHYINLSLKRSNRAISITQLFYQEPGYSIRTQNNNSKKQNNKSVCHNPIGAFDCSAKLNFIFVRAAPAQPNWLQLTDTCDWNVSYRARMCHPCVSVCGPLGGGGGRQIKGTLRRYCLLGQKTSFQFPVLWQVYDPNYAGETKQQTCIWLEG